MMQKFTQISMHATAADKLRRYKIAVAYLTGHMPSNAEVVDDLIENVKKTNPSLYNIFSSLGKEEDI